MGCFSCCFRIRDDPHHHHRQINNRFSSQPITAIHKEPSESDPLASNCVWSLITNEDEDEDEDVEECEDGGTGLTGSQVLDEELRAEAKFLQACGTLSQTPVEIKKTEKSNDSQPHNGDTESAFSSGLPNTVIDFEEELHKQPVQSKSPVDLFQKWENGSDSSSHSSTSLENTDSVSSNSVEGHRIGPAASTQCKTKSVHFESPSECSFSSNSSSPKTMKKPYESPLDQTISKPTPYPTPYPTPLQLTDDMQTPGTVFPSYGKSQRTRVEYVYSGIDPRNFSQLDTQIEEYTEQSEKESPKLQAKLEESTNKKELNMCPTLSSWLPGKSNQEGCIDQSVVGQTPQDRPSSGMVTSDWTGDETSFTPKWAENGIPNTTNKYSEDKKVTWHATPFEERLEKALSEEKFIPRVKQLGETSVSNFDEKEEHDNALEFGSYL